MASQLRSLAIATGVNTSGTKPVLISQLNDSLTEEKFPSPKKDGIHILSIDMGIRNLAYCQIRLPKAWPSSGNKNPIVSDWDRVTISKKISEDPSTPASKEAFDPATFSQHAYSLIEKLVLSTNIAPDLVLIERQRFRSLGGSAVLEWTLRVNTFEAMLYAILKAMSMQGNWEGRVFPVMPSKVGHFWIGHENKVEKKKGNGKAKKRDIKFEKIQIVDEMLKRGTEFTLEERAENMAERWREKMEGRHRRNLEVGEKMGKLDDLADCLLQGLAWSKWEENRREVLKHGVDALDNLCATA